jgi:murein DD-endopeptidase MepM/ murein hydrolase activator NlpD
MASPDDVYTIVIFRGHTATPWRVSISRRHLRVVAVVAACLVIAQLVLLSQYVSTTGEVLELRALRDEVVSTRQQATAFSSSVEDLKRRLMAMREINQRLRVMLGIDEDRVDDYNGRGGSEQPFVIPEAPVTGEPGLPPGESPASSGDSRAEAGSSSAGLASFKLNEALSRLRNEALVEERMLDHLTRAAKEMMAKLAATPSVRPVEGWVTSGFGPRISPFTNQPAMHDGLDIGAAPQTPVKATAGGRVTSVGFDQKMGNLVAIDHGYGIETQYGHLAKPLVKSGQKVKRGDIIGLVGSTGFSTGPHLHYMVKVHNRAVDPERYILD